MELARRDVGACLRVAGELTAERTAKELDKVGVKKGELAKVGKAVVAAAASRSTPMKTWRVARSS